MVLKILLVRFLDVLGINLADPGAALLGAKSLLLGTLIVVGLLMIVPLLTGAATGFVTKLSTEVEVGGVPAGLTLIGVVKVLGSWEPAPVAVGV